MNAKQAKQLDFPMLLQKMGYSPIKDGIKRGGDEIWYQSPLNLNDKTPSFHISRGHTVAWVFKCFSTGREGSIIDFVIAKQGYPPKDIASALAYLRTQFQGALFEYQAKRREINDQSAPSFSFHKPVQNTQKQTSDRLSDDKQLEYLEDLPLHSGGLLKYLQEERKIPKSLAQKYLRLVRYKNLNNGKTYYSIGMKNRAGGFDIRSGSSVYSFKSVLLARDLTLINGRDNSQVILVEGMMDALSLLVYEKAMTPPYDLIVMHSVNTYGKCIQFIKEQKYNNIHTFLDNDKTGSNYSLKFEKEFGEKVKSHSNRFAPHKDINKALQMGLNIQFFPNRNITQNLECAL